ncbi:hypothetical protein FTO74_04350 [Granulicella sp. WH15]|uniref:hypothetical protein n=1 Tax=Granulicella sp. WH15 TaxID=2602070 RepID=UPI0013673017|nr:hypothetical protein [Granulicella sp. WH15]QHN02685.1 hypothetical protein FTO74_04350 [Granulicella sp. WH15]
MSRAQAQALPTATRNSGVDVFFTGGHGDTDYGTTGTAFSVGGDVALFGRPRFGLQTAIEARLIDMPSDYIGTKDFAGGIRVGRPLHFHRITPYADFLIGYGTISFPGLRHPGYTHDNSVTYNFGGGVDVPVFGPFAAKVDYQEESWKLGDASSRLTPSAFTVGVVYTLPLSFHIHR